MVYNGELRFGFCFVLKFHLLAIDGVTMLLAMYVMISCYLL